MQIASSGNEMGHKMKNRLAAVVGMVAFASAQFTGAAHAARGGNALGQDPILRALATCGGGLHVEVMYNPVESKVWLASRSDCLNVATGTAYSQSQVDAIMAQATVCIPGPLLTTLVVTCEFYPGNSHGA